MNAKKITVGMPLLAASATLDVLSTKPPESYTEDALMNDMLSAYKFAANESDRELLKQISGIGTSRTRGGIIKSFIDRGFLIRTKKAKLYQLKVAPKGRALLSNLPAEVKDVTLTAKWERALEMVASGAATPQQVRDKVSSILVNLIAKILPPSSLKN